MANFDGSQAKRESVKLANNLHDHLRSHYESGVQIQTALALYQAGTDPVFNATIGALYSAAERAELAVMLNQVNDLVSDWSANHAGAIAG